MTNLIEATNQTSERGNHQRFRSRRCSDTTWKFDVRDGKSAGDRKALQIRNLLSIWTPTDPEQLFLNRAPSNKKRKGQHSSIDGLADETLDTARETRSAKVEVVLTARNELRQSS